MSLVKGDVVVYDGTMYEDTIILCTFQNYDPRDEFTIRNTGIAYKGASLLLAEKFSASTSIWTREPIAMCGECGRYMVTPEVDYICSACRLPSDVFHAKLAVHGYLRKIEASAFMP